MTLTVARPEGVGGGLRPGRHWWRPAVAIVAGLVAVAAFPRFGWWPLAPLSVTLLDLAVRDRRPRVAFGLGLAYGLAFCVPLLSWTGVYVGPFPWLLLAAFESLFFAAAAVAMTLVQRLPAGVGPFAVAAVWVLQEAIRDRVPFGGFPWGRLAFSQASSPLRWFIALGGAPLLTFVVALVGAAVAQAVVRWGVGATGGPGATSRRGVAIWLAVALLVPVVGAGLSVPLRPTGGRPVTIALVQGSLPELGLQFETRQQQVLDDHVAETMKLNAEIKAGTLARPDIVLWPEDSSDVDPFETASAYREISTTVDTIGIPILVGAILNGPGDHRRNVGILWSPVTGPGAEYTKRHPVPFGEYIPLRSVAKLFSSDVNLVTQDMVAGHGDGLLSGGPFPIGDVICFEVAYDSLVESSVSAGAELVVVQTNNSTFGRTAETYQQLAMSRLRAVETGRTVAQVATTGKSAVITPTGSIQAESGALFTPDLIDVQVRLRTAITLATDLGAVPEYVLAALAVMAIGWAWRRSQARPRRRTVRRPTA